MSFLVNNDTPSNDGHGVGACLRQRAPFLPLQPGAFFPIADSPQALAASPLDAEGDPHTASDAKGGEAFAEVVALKLMQQGDQDARARCANGMAQGNCTAADIDDVGVPAHARIDCAGLRGKGLIGLNAIKVLDRPAGLLERPLGSRYGTRAHDGGIDPGGRPGRNAGEGCQTASGGLFLAHQHQCRGAVIET